MTTTTTTTTATTTGARQDVPREKTGILFPDAMPGLEMARWWELAELDEAKPFMWLRSTDRAPLSLVVVDPRLVRPDYRPELSPTELERIGVSSADACVLLAVVTTRSQGEASVNLRAPIVINPERMLGAQVILQDSQWPLRHRL